MYASGIYVTGLVPCLVNAVDFLLYKLHVLVSELQSTINFTVSCEAAQNVNKCDVTASILHIEDLLKVGHLHMRKCAGLHELLHTHAQ